MNKIRLKFQTRVIVEIDAKYLDDMDGERFKTELYAFLSDQKIDARVMRSGGGLYTFNVLPEHMRSLETWIDNWAPTRPTPAR